jgi:hypothetical protein
VDRETRDLFARSIRDATAKHTGPALDVALEELGWHDALGVDERDAVSILFELQGAANAASSTLEAVMLPERDAGAVLPALGQWQSPATMAGARLAVHGVALAARDRYVVVAPVGDGHIAAVVDAGALDLQPVQGLDPSLGLLRVRGEVHTRDAPATDWATAIASGQRAVAHELVGASRTMLELARTHALERVQFGRPIATFQAVRHRLAETLVAIETADAALAAAWDDGSTSSARMAKAIAGRSARTAARHCQQVLAGIGFTTEHPLHRFIKRALVLDQLLGSSTLLTKELGEQLVTTRSLPPLLPL